MSDDDRPRRKRTWKELDAQKDRSGGGTRRPSEYERKKERATNSSAYRNYKSNLDKLFTPGSGADLPESLKAKLGPIDEASQQRGELTRALRENTDAESLSAFLDFGLTLPEDARLLMSLLEIKDEKLLVVVLEALLELVEGGKKPNRRLLIQKVDALQLRYPDTRVAELALDVRGALDG